MKCPGQDTQYWSADAIFETRCPECGHAMEFFKDDATRRCPGCGKKTVNPKMDFGCAAYCQFAEACLGTLPEEFVAARDDLFKDRVAVEVKKLLGTDFKRIALVMKKARYAEAIGKKEKANLAVVLCAAYLHGMDGTARTLLEKLGARTPLVDAVCQMLEKETADTVDSRVLHDADMLAHMAGCDKKDGVDRAEFSAKIDRLYRTEGGKALAREVLIPE